jgi:site-specific recombinase XerD
MAYVVSRNKRHTGYYRTNGKVRSAGTYPTRAKALNSALLAEEGIVSANPELITTLEAYVKDWLTNRTDVRVITKKTYGLTLKKYVLPSLGHRQVTGITRKDVRQLIEKLASEGVSKSTLAHVKIAMGSVFKQLVEEEQLQVNPTHGIKIKAPKSDPKTSLEPKDFKKIVRCLNSDGAKMFAQFLIASGCRFGEATELRVKDINFTSKEVYVRRTVSEVGKAFNDGHRYLIVSATKNGNKRTVVLSKSLIESLKAFIQANKLNKEDLLFSKALIQEFGKIRVKEGQTQKGRKPYTVGSRTFQHATPYSYNVGGCRCDLCKQAVKDYRKQYRKDKSKQRSLSQSMESLDQSHLSRSTWRSLWNEAIEKSGIGWYPTTHDLRHANATQLLKSGVDVHEVKERLGHQSITTTERYLHRIRHKQSEAGELANDYLE